MQSAVVRFHMHLRASRLGPALGAAAAWISTIAPASRHVVCADIRDLELCLLRGRWAVVTIALSSGGKLTSFVRGGGGGVGKDPAKDV
jgi:membrane associated rhomboid family serine protease